MTKKQTYRTLRRHGPHEAGAELSLTEDEAIRLNNESPGVLEPIIPPEVEREQERTQGEGRAGSKPAAPTEDAKPTKATP